MTEDRFCETIYFLIDFPILAIYSIQMRMINMNKIMNGTFKYCWSLVLLMVWMCNANALTSSQDNIVMHMPDTVCMSCDALTNTTGSDGTTALTPDKQKVSDYDGFIPDKSVSCTLSGQAVSVMYTDYMKVGRHIMPKRIPRDHMAFGLGGSSMLQLRPS